MAGSVEGSDAGCDASSLLWPSNLLYDLKHSKSMFSLTKVGDHAAPVPAADDRHTLLANSRHVGSLLQHRRGDIWTCSPAKRTFKPTSGECQAACSAVRSTKQAEHQDV